MAAKKVQVPATRGVCQARTRDKAKAAGIVSRGSARLHDGKPKRGKSEEHREPGGHLASEVRSGRWQLSPAARVPTRFAFSSFSSSIRDMKEKKESFPETLLLPLMRVSESCKGLKQQRRAGKSQTATFQSEPSP